MAIKKFGQTDHQTKKTLLVGIILRQKSGLWHTSALEPFHQNKIRLKFIVAYVFLEIASGHALAMTPFSFKWKRFADGRFCHCESHARSNLK